MDGLSVTCFATQGSGSNDEQRIRQLLDGLAPSVVPFDRAAKVTSCIRLLRGFVRARPDVVVMEGTGIAGGVAVLVGRSLFGIRYIVSSGDAVGPFVGSFSPWAGPLASLYERILCAKSAGFIGWSPYLVGRALTLGAPRGMTAAGWSPHSGATERRAAIRRELGIADDAIVFGLVGSLMWNARVGYCYGLDLVRALEKTSRPDLHVLIVGDGDGRNRLEAEKGRRAQLLTLTGAVPRPSVPAYLSAMDVVSLPQSVDRVGSFRYTTKLSEYLAAGIPVVTGQLPLAYDLDQGWLWRLPGNSPWDERYVAALAKLMDSVQPGEIDAKREQIPKPEPTFDRERQRRSACDFVAESART